MALTANELLELAQKGVVRGVDLSHGVYDGLCLDALRFEQVNAYQATFSGGSLNDTVWVDCHLSEAHFQQLSLVNSFFTGCELGQATFESVALQRTYWQQSNMQAVNLSASDVAGSTFSQVNLQQARLPVRFGPAYLTECDVTGLRLPPQSHWFQVQSVQCCFDNSQFVGAHLEQVAIHKSQLFQADFSQVHAPYLSLWQSQAAEAIFIDAHLMGANFESVNLTKADFSRAHLEKASLAKACAKQARFIAAQMHYVNGAHLQATLADFSQAQLLLSNFHAAQIDGVIVAESALRSMQPKDELLLRAEQWQPATHWHIEPKNKGVI